MVKNDDGDGDDDEYYILLLLLLLLSLLFLSLSVLLSLSLQMPLEISCKPNGKQTELLGPQIFHHWSLVLVLYWFNLKVSPTHYSWLVVSNMFFFHFIYGMSSFPLTNSYFARWLLHHQPIIVIIGKWPAWADLKNAHPTPEQPEQKLGHP